MYGEDFHIGLKNTDGAANCNSASNCNGTLNWVNSAGQAVSPLIGSYITHDLDNGGTGNCFYIEASHNYEILEEPCNTQDMGYICEFECPVACPDPVDIPLATSDWSSGMSTDQGVTVG